MRKLILTSDNGAREFPVGKGITIGRNGANTIQLEGQKVEDNHAKVAPKGNLLFIEDLDTPHGILVNGKKVTRWSLNKGDVIEIGGATLRYEEDDKPEPAPAKPSVPATKPAVAAASKTAAKPGAEPARPAAKAAPAAKPAAAAKASQTALPAVARAAAAAPKSEVKIVLPAASAQRPGSGLRAAVKDGPDPKATSGRMAAPHPEPAASTAKAPAALPSPNSSVRIKLGAEARALAHSVKEDPAPPSHPRSSLSKIALADHVLEGPASRKSGGSASGVLPALGSGRLASPGTSGRMIALDKSKELQSKALKSARASAREDRTLVKPVSRRTKIIAGAAAVVISMGLGAAMLVPALRNWSARSQAEAEAGRVVDEAIERLRQAGPKHRQDLATAMPKLKAARKWPDIEAILGQPDLTVKDKIQLYSSETGVYDYPGNTLKAYYVEDALYPNPKEGEKAPILLFMINAQDQVSFVEGDRVLARSANIAPEQKNSEQNSIHPESIEIEKQPAPLEKGADSKSADLKKTE
ncbi:MAG: FHA domain-containing protein [Planctomycetes bacterium]|nr:FHA domain-containing protein [Planctomycetota bacterium]